MINAGGTFPRLAFPADHFPGRSETGIGGFTPWAGKSRFVTYVAPKTGSAAGTGLFSIDGNMRLEKRPDSRVGTYANRMVHAETSQRIRSRLHLNMRRGGMCCGP